MSSHRAELDKCELPALLLVDVAGVVVHVRLVALHWHALQDHLQQGHGKNHTLSDSERTNQICWQLNRNWNHLYVMPNTCIVVWLIVPEPSLSKPSKPFFKESIWGIKALSCSLGPDENGYERGRLGTWVSSVIWFFCMTCLRVWFALSFVDDDWFRATVVTLWQ